MGTVTITVTPQELDILGAGLGELPLKVAAPVMNKLRQQFDAQREAAAKADAQREAAAKAAAKAAAAPLPEE